MLKIYKTYARSNIEDRDDDYYLFNYTTQFWSKELNERNNLTTRWRQINNSMFLGLFELRKEALFNFSLKNVRSFWHNQAYIYDHHVVSIN